MSSTEPNASLTGQAAASGAETTHIQATPTFGEKVAGEAKKLRGQVMGNEEMKAQGQAILDGTDAPSTRRKIEEATGKTPDQVDIQTQ